MAVHQVRQTITLIINMVKRDVQTKYLGSYLGILWAFIQPLSIILLYWFVFQLGFRSVPVGNVPFIVWLTTGLIPWFFFSEGLSSATHSITESSYLVKKVLFRVSLLPVIKICSALLIHLFFVFVLLCLLWIYGLNLSIYSLQAIYYIFAAFVFTTALSWLTSSIIVFFKDLGQIIGVVLQMGFWLTPIVWFLNVMPDGVQKILKLNPLFYIVEGYRDSFLYQEWFWNHTNLTLYFWGVTLCVLLLGVIVFKKLKPHFADVL